MCTQRITRYRDCPCTDIGAVVKCEGHADGSGSCEGVKKKYRYDQADKCATCTAEVSSQGSSPPRSRVYGCNTLWPRRGQLSMEAMNPEYFHQVQRRNSIMSIPMARFLHENQAGARAGAEESESGEEGQAVVKNEDDMSSDGTGSTVDSQETIEAGEEEVKSEGRESTEEGQVVASREAGSDYTTVSPSSLAGYDVIDSDSDILSTIYVAGPDGGYDTDLESYRSTGAASGDEDAHWDLEGTITAGAAHGAAEQSNHDEADTETQTDAETQTDTETQTDSGPENCDRLSDDTFEEDSDSSSDDDSDADRRAGSGRRTTRAGLKQGSATARRSLAAQGGGPAAREAGRRRRAAKLSARARAAAK